jgi:preprotein translocase subunit YajC
MDAWSWLGDAFMSLIPPVLVGLLFWVIMRSILNADKTERKVYQKMEAEMRAAQAVSEQAPKGDKA